MVDLDVGSGRSLLGRMVSRHIQGIFVRVLRYGVGAATSRVLRPHVLQTQGLEAVHDGLGPVVELVGAPEGYVQVACRQDSMLVRAVVVADKRSQVGDDAVSRGVGIDPVSNCGWVRPEPADVHRSRDERFWVLLRDHLGDSYGANAAHGHVSRAGLAHRANLAGTIQS